MNGGSLSDWKEMCIRDRVTVLLVGLLTLAVAAGIGVAVKAYGSIKQATEANALMGNAVTAVQDELRFAYDVEAVSGASSGVGPAYALSLIHIYGSITENTTGAGTATKLYSFGGLLGDAYTTGETAFASVTNCSIDCEITAFGGHSSQSYVGGIVGRGRVNSNDNRWRAVEVGLSAFTGTLKGNGYNAPIIAGVRRGASESAATGTAIALSLIHI